MLLQHIKLLLMLQLRLHMHKMLRHVLMMHLGHSLGQRVILLGMRLLLLLLLILLVVALALMLM